MARRRASALACALALCAPFALSACDPAEEQATGQARREGLALPVGGVEYNVFITRQLNPRIVPDKAYYRGPDAGKGQSFYGIFVQACNHSEQTQATANKFTVVDNQGSEFEPAELPKDNAFAYHPAKLLPDQCIPETGSVAQLGPTAGSLLLFKLPLDVTENRPLELEIESPFDVTRAKREKLTVELDL